MLETRLLKLNIGQSAYRGNLPQAILKTIKAHFFPILTDLGWQITFSFFILYFVWQRNLERLCIKFLSSFALIQCQVVGRYQVRFPTSDIAFLAFKLVNSIVVISSYTVSPYMEWMGEVITILLC